MALLEKTNEDRAVQLQMLLEILAEKIDQQPGARDLAQLVKQYRDTLAELEDIEEKTSSPDEIVDILAQRKADGKPGPIRRRMSPNYSP